MELFYDKKTGWDKLDTQSCMDYAEGYKSFLDAGETERDAVSYLTEKAEAKGYKAWTRGMPVQSGDKLYQINRDKSLILTHIGKAPLSEGFHLTAPPHILMPHVSTFAPYRFTKGTEWHISRPITMAVSKSINGLPFRSSCAVLFVSARTEPSHGSLCISATSPTTPNLSSQIFCRIWQVSK